MKLIDNKGRLLGLVNIIDLAVIVMLIAVLGVGLTKFMGAEVPGDDGEDTKETIVTVKYTPQNQVELKAFNKGDQLIANNELQPVFVENIDLQPEKVFVEKDGSIREINHPSNQEMYITLKGEASISNINITLANQLVRVGNPFVVKTLTAEIKGNIVSLDIQE